MNIPSMGAIIPMLAGTHTVYAVDLEGHGRTTDVDRPITYPALADDGAAFMDAVGLKEADVFGYSMGAGVGLHLAIRLPARVKRLVAASVPYDARGWQPEFTALIPQMTVEMVLGMPFAEEYRKLASNADGFSALARKLIALEHEPLTWEKDVTRMKTPVLIVTGDADVVTLECSVSMFRLLGGGAMGDMGKPLAASRLAVPAGHVPHRGHHAAGPAPRVHRALPEGRDAEGHVRAVTRSRGQGHAAIGRRPLPTIRPPQRAW